MTTESIESDGYPWPEADPLSRASLYLAWVRRFLPGYDWVTIPSIDQAELAVLTVIGSHIQAINQQLALLLADLINCWPNHRQRSVQVLAAPLTPHLQIDGFCNMAVVPTTLIVDPGRVEPGDWPHLIAHELAHAMAETPGHGPGFYRALEHLCLAQGLPLPPLQPELLRFWPPCQPNPHPARFWLGNWP
ncbi:MAG: hypothetical protein ACKO63_13300 [Nodosilinea sp.]